MMPEPTKETFEYALFLMCEAIRKWEEREAAKAAESAASTNTTPLSQN
jgi:hypothetical protein